MTVTHYIVFVGATASLSTELEILSKRTPSIRIIAPAIKKKAVGISKPAINLALEKLRCVLGDESDPEQLVRLTLWMYEPTINGQFDQIWKAFGHAAWVETVPNSYLNKVKPTREYIEIRVKQIGPLLHELSNGVYAQRKSSPLSLPLRNFRSKITQDLKQYWYNDLTKERITKKIKGFKSRLSQTRVNTGRNGEYAFKDERSMLYQPAKDTECHGKPHPAGTEAKSFTCGRFRYGVALFPGFHYDVSSEKSATIQCELRKSDGSTRAIKGEKKTYINIFPNDHLLPEK